MYLFYGMRSEQGLAGQSHRTLEAGYHAVLWQPSMIRVIPHGHVTIRLALKCVVWWLFHHLRIFSNRNYGMFLIYKDGQVVHRSFVFPRYFRFGFMQENDLQVGDTWTEERHRGLGLATYAMAEIVRLLGHENRMFWYLTAAENIKSVKVIERTGFQKIGTGVRTRWLGMAWFGQYVLHRAGG